MYDPDRAQFEQAVLDKAEVVARIVDVAKNIRGADGKLDPADLLKVSGLVPDVVDFIQFLTEGAVGPEDDAYIAARGISVFVAYARGAGFLEKLPGLPTPAPEV